MRVWAVDMGAYTHPLLTNAEPFVRLVGASAIGMYQWLWDSLHAELGTTWADNPWIVAHSFVVHHGNIDQSEHNSFPSIGEER